MFIFSCLLDLIDRQYEEGSPELVVTLLIPYRVIFECVPITCTVIPQDTQWVFVTTCPIAKCTKICWIPFWLTCLKSKDSVYLDLWLYVYVHLLLIHTWLFAVMHIFYWFSRFLIPKERSRCWEAVGAQNCSSAYYSGCVSSHALLHSGHFW